MSSNDNSKDRLPSFDELMALHQADPEAFERMRAKLLQQVVDDAPASQRASLEHLVAQLNQARAAAPSNYAAAQDAFRLMQESVARLGGAMQLAREELASMQAALLLKEISRKASLEPATPKRPHPMRRHRDRM